MKDNSFYVYAVVCKNSNQLSLGALLLEAKLMEVPDIPPPTKRARSNMNIANHEDWMCLAEYVPKTSGICYQAVQIRNIIHLLVEEHLLGIVKVLLASETKGSFTLGSTSSVPPPCDFG